MNRFLMAAALFTFGLGVALAQPPAQQERRPADQAPAAQQQAQKADDVKFWLAAATDGMMEVKLGRFAEQRATNADVKNLARKLADDHTKANQELLQILG